MPISTVQQPTQVGRTTAPLPRPPAIGMISTYPPTQCGLATFSAALIQHMQLSTGSLGVVQVVDEPEPRPGPEVVAQLVNGSPDSAGAAVRRLNGFDVVVVQHEYGIYGGPDGVDVLGIVDALTVPTIIVLHTVLQDPTASAAAHPAAAARRGRRRRDHDPDRPQTARRELRRRSGAGRGDPARRGRPRALVLGRAPTRRPPARPHLGVDRAGEGHRVGDRRHGGAARPAAALPGDGPDPPQGRCSATARPTATASRNAPGPRVCATSSSSTTATSTPASWPSWCGSRRGAAALRLAGAGDVRGAHRGRRGRATGGLHGLPARDRAAGRRDRARGAAARPRGAGSGAAPGAQRARAWPRSWPSRRRGRRPSCCGPRWPTATAAIAAAASRPAWRRPRDRARRDAVAPVEIPAPMFAHLRRLTDAGGLYEHARGRHPASGARLLPRRRGAGAGGRLPRAGRAAELDDLREQYLTFVLAAQEPDGRFHNRRRSDLTLAGHGIGRGLLGPRALGPRRRRRADAAPARAGARRVRPWRRLRSPHRRAMAFAALGAAEVLAVLPGPRARPRAAGRGRDRGRPARARPGVAMAGAPAELRERGAARGLLAAGAALDSPVARRGRPRPAGLAARPADPGRASVGRPGRRLAVRGTPARHSTSSRSRWRRWPTPAHAAHRSTGDGGWADGVELAAAWFLGDNDSGTPMHDPVYRWRLRRSGALRAQREPGRGVHFGAALDAAAGPALVPSARGGLG